AARAAQPCDGRPLLCEPRAGRAARLGRGGQEVRARDPEEPGPEADEGADHARDGRADPARKGRGDRAARPAGLQKNYTSDDYTDYTWHCPTVRLMIGRATLEPPEAGYQYPDWAWNALGGFAPTIDPTVFAAARTIGLTFLDLMTKPALLAAAKAEFKER